MGEGSDAYQNDQTNAAFYFLGTYNEQIYNTAKLGCCAL